LQIYVLIGTGGHATSILDLITSIGGEVQYFVGFNSEVNDLKGIPVVDISQIGNLSIDFNFVFGIGGFEIRNKILEEIKLSNPALKFPPLFTQPLSYLNQPKLVWERWYLQMRM
jgi:hypothetical protein